MEGACYQTGNVEHEKYFTKYLVLRNKVTPRLTFLLISAHQPIAKRYAQRSSSTDSEHREADLLRTSRHESHPIGRLERGIQYA